MKSGYFKTLALIILTAVLAAFSFTLQSFTGTLQGREVRLEWKISDESGVTEYELSRKLASESFFSKVATVNPSQAGHYMHVDNTLSPNTDPSHQINYRLTVKLSNGQTQAFFANVNFFPTAVQRSWGSIKSMFR
jgi:outer membrane lipopolysaccharide assembly protein LptE/RlpB